MISTLKQMLPSIGAWPEEDQQALAEAAREIAAMRSGVYVMTDDEAAAVDEGLARSATFLLFSRIVAGRSPKGAARVAQRLSSALQ